MFSNDDHDFDLVDLSPLKDSETTLVDLNEDGIDDSFMSSVDTNGDGTLDETFIYADSDGDGQPESAVTFVDIDIDHDGILDITNIETDFNNDGVPEIVTVDYVPYNTSSFLGAQSLGTLFGDPSEDMEHWHWQERSDSCAVACQEFILDDFGENLRLDFTEDQLVELATDNGWYQPGGGTTLANVGKLLEAHGITVERTSGATLSDLAQKLEQGEKIIAAVDSDELQPMLDVALEDWTGDSIPGQDANHAVQVIGIQTSESGETMVILNDPGHPQGQGMMVPAEQFVSAWEDSGNYMVATAVNDTSGQVAIAYPSSSEQPMLTGSHDRAGNWHWDDGTIEPGYNWETGYV